MVIKSANMTYVERIVWLKQPELNYEFHVLAPSDTNAIFKAVRLLESKKGLMRGALTKYYKEHPDDIIVKLK
jgi:hypothetical protein